MNLGNPSEDFGRLLDFGISLDSATKIVEMMYTGDRKRLWAVHAYLRQLGRQIE